MPLVDRITTYILKRSNTTLSHLEGVVVSAGFSTDDLYTALEAIHRNKQIKRRVLSGEIVYSPAPEKKTPTDHFKWVIENYVYSQETEYGKPIPFYEPEYDGPTPYFSKETDVFLKKKNDDMKKKMEKKQYGNTRG